MSRSSYSSKPCPVCGRYISINGANQRSHYRKHAREGLMTENKGTYDNSLTYFTINEAGFATRNARLQVIEDNKMIGELVREMGRHANITLMHAGRREWVVIDPELSKSHGCRETPLEALTVWQEARRKEGLK